MKLRNLFFLSLLVAACTYYISNAQVLTPYKAKEGLKVAQDSAKSAGFSSPELVAVAAMAGQIPGMPISMDIDINNGTASAWIYAFRSAAKPDSAIGFIVVKLLFIYTAFPISEAMTGGIGAPTYSLEGKTWFDSDVMAQKLKADTKYKNFMENYPDSKLSGVALIANYEIENNPPYWMTNITNPADTTAPSLECMINAETGEVICEALTSVQDNITSIGKMTVYPAPASDIAFIKLPADLQRADGRMEIVDLLGNTVKLLKSPSFGEAELISVSVNDLSRGMYYIRYSTRDFVVSSPLVIER